MTVYNGRYELSTQVARGGTAQVYLARDLLLDRPVALKVLFPELSTDHTFVERFRREAQAAANLSHPNIVPVFDWGQSDSTYFIVMEYVDGEALSSIIKTQAPLEPHQAASIAADIAKALSYAHRHGVVHRDVKPGNVMITSDGQVKVTDFGIARAIGRDEQVTQTGLVMGTATYFSPEQAQGLDVDGRSDIYSLGVVLYEMLCGRPPFAGDSPVSIAYQHVRETPATPRSVNPSIPASLEAVVLEAMAKLPAERYPTAEDLRADLDRYLRGQTVLARPPSEYASGPQTEAVASTRRTRETTRTTVVEEEESPKRTTPYWIAAAVVLLVAIAATVGIGGRALGYFGGAKYFKIPKVTGLTQKAASDELTGDKLKVAIRHVTAPTAAEAHLVIAQDPKFPSDVRQGDVVTLNVAGNAPTISIPSVVGLPEATAAIQLQNAGFKVATKKVRSSTVMVGDVAKESPSGGSKRAPGSTITLSVVVGKQMVAIPLSIVSSATNPISQAVAGAAIGTAQLTVNPNGPMSVVSSLPAGDVVGSMPAPGTQVPIGTPVTLIVSGGPGVTIPDLTCDAIGDAETALSSAGFTDVVEVQQPTTDNAIVGLVEKTVPRAGKGPYIPAQQKVQVYVWTTLSGQTSTPGGNSGVTGSSGTTCGSPATTTTTTIPPTIPTTTPTTIAPPPSS